MSIIGENIKMYRKLHGLTQSELAKIIGKTKNAVSNWENGINKPDADTIERLLDIFGIDANTLLGWSDPSKIKSDAIELAEMLLNNKKIRDTLPLIQKLSDRDVELTKTFIERLIKEEK